MLGLLIFSALASLIGYLYFLAVKHQINVPEPYGQLFFGVLFDMYGLTRQRAFNQSIKYFLSDDEKIIKLSMTPWKRILAVKDPEYVKILLNNYNSINKGSMYTFLDWDRSILSVDVDEWRPLRKHFNKGFTLTALKSFVKIFDKNSRMLTEKLEKYVGKGHFELRSHVLVASLANVCETSLGVGFDDDNIYREIVHNVHTFHELAVTQMFSLHHWFKWISVLTPTYWQKWWTNRKVNKRLFELVHKRAALSGSPQEIDSEVKNFFDQLMSESVKEDTKFTDAEIVANTNLLISASLTTNSNLTSHCLIFLSIHPKIQERVRDEILHVFPDKNEKVTYDKLSQLEYLDMVVKESLRLVPSVGNMIHRTKADIELEPGVVIPKDFDFIISPIAIHRWKKIWGPGADSFNPNRFTKEEIQKRHPYSYIPFSAGPRNCLGYKYGPLTVKTTLVYLLRNYRFKTPYRMCDLEWGSDAAVHLEKPYLFSIEKCDSPIIDDNNNDDVKEFEKIISPAAAAE